MTTLAKYVWPTTAEIRGRMRMAREITFKPLPDSSFASESEQGLFHLARRLHEALHAALADLDLYVGKEPTQVEEMAYLTEENDRLHTWPGLMTVLDEHYPPDAVIGDTDQRIAVLVRVIDRLRTDNERLTAENEALEIGLGIGGPS